MQIQKNKSDKDTVAYQWTVSYKLIGMHIQIHYTNLNKSVFDCATQK